MSNLKKMRNLYTMTCPVKVNEEGQCLPDSCETDIYGKSIIFKPSIIIFYYRSWDSPNYTSLVLYV